MSARRIGHRNTRQQPAPKSNSRTWAIVATALAGTTISVLLFLTLRWDEQRLFREEFKHRSADRMLSIENKFESSTALIRSLAAYLQTSTDVDQNSFRDFTSHLLLQDASIHALGWNRRLTSLTVCAGSERTAR